MIDLRLKELPSCVECDGIFYELNTDFRTWIEFERYIREEEVVWAGVFKKEIPPGFDWIEGVMEFYRSENVTPHYPDPPREELLNLILDGDYIVAAFQQAYGIDLTTCDMHWHRFKALLVGLPENTILSKAMGYRGYKKPPRDHEAEMRKHKKAWTFPLPDTEDIKARMLEIAESWEQS